MSIVCRFAPSPTGFLHIGGARTALFNWLFARHAGGKFRLRIEDTDRARSTKEAVDAILGGMNWLGLDWDDEVVHQFSRVERHARVARELLAQGRAYHCYCSPEELDAMRKRALAEGKPLRYDGTWRDRDPKDAPPGVKPVIRLKARQDGETVIRDKVQGDVVIANSQLDDMVLLRADGTPVYMLAVVVDDQDMGVTHVIRGDDHLNNAARQMQLIEALGWPVPVYAHVPMIHGPDGAKLSKRHGALAVEAYRDMGFLPAAMRNYLLRLGWSHGDDEIISTEQAVAWFGLEAIGRSPARLDLVKLANLNAHYLRAEADATLAELVVDRLTGQGLRIDAAGRDRITRGMAGLKARAKTVIELADAAAFYARPRPLALDDKARALLASGKPRLAALTPVLEAGPWNAAAIEARVRDHATQQGVKLGDLAQPLRAALSGSTQSPPIFEVLEILGKEESAGRITDALNAP